MMRDPADELRELEDAGLRRRLRPVDTPPQSPRGVRVRTEDGGECLNFSSNDYLGLAGDPESKESLLRHVERHGAGSGASRLVCGTRPPHLELEERIAALKRAGAAIAFSSGFAAATGTIPALCGKEDVVILDKLCHASLIDGARLSGATLRVFPHNHLDKLANHLRWATSRVGPDGRILVVTESVFSMDGDRAPLREICDLKDEAGALLLLDEAHAFGVLGPQGRGLAAELGLEPRIDLQMGTFSKAVGLSGGYVCAGRDLVDLLVNRARSFIYSTAPMPALAAATVDALDLVTGERGDALRERLGSHLVAFTDGAESAIVPLVIGENEPALAASDALRERRFLVPAIRYPTVPPGTARLRITFSAAHTEEQVESLKKALVEVGMEAS